MSRQKPIDERVLLLAITLEQPPSGVLFALQGRPGELFNAVRSTGDDLVFELSVRVAGALETGAPRFLGAFVQGPPTQRFVYICSGTSAGDASSCWTRRAKVPLHGISAALVARAKPDQRLIARIDGRAKDGGPACASVPLLDGGWRVDPKKR